MKIPEQKKSVYLTIDDAPSMHMHKKVDFLLEHKIPCVFFCRGEFIEKHKDQLVYAIRQGFLLGNHSYSHPYFSETPLSECFTEIQKTEELLEDCYKTADIVRPQKVIRLPFGDRGGFGKKCLSVELDGRAQEIQYYLKQLGFQTLDFSPHDVGSFIDAPFTWDTHDYEKSLIDDVGAYIQKLNDYWENSPHKTEILLLHDFDNSHHLFEATMNFLMQKTLSFLKAEILSLSSYKSETLLSRMD